MKRLFGHNFGVVFRFEVVRTLKKKSFWLALFAFPVMMSAIFGIIFLANNQAEKSTEDLAKQEFLIGITDDSGKIAPEIMTNSKVQSVENRNQGVELVKAGKLDAYFYYPKDLKNDKVEVFGQSVGIFENGRYQSAAATLLQQSATHNVAPDLVAILTGSVQFNSVTFKDGKEYNPLMEMIAPGIFLVLLYVIIAIFGNQMLNATIEEKENRVMEIILTTIKSRTLIAGKIIAMLALIFVQMAVILGFILIAYFAFKNHLSLPSIDLSHIPLDPVRIAAGFGLFVGGVLLLSGLMVAIGAAVPTAKEANQFFGVIAVMLFGPLYAAPLFVTNPDSLAVAILTFFPFTAPIPLLLRNAVGNLTPLETVGGIVMLLVFSAIIFIVAARLFQNGSVEYSRKISLKSLLPKKSAQ